MKLQMVEELRIGFDFYFFDRIYRINRIFFHLQPVGFGRRPHYPDDPVDPVQLVFLRHRGVSS
jgi:hypothetical protein